MPSPFHPFYAHRAAAFTLIEVMVSIALFSVISLMLMPAFGQWMGRLRVESAVQALRASVGYARTEAVRRGVSTTICRSGADGQCSKAPRFCAGYVADGDDWRCGWQVVTGHRRDIANRFDAAAGAEVLRRFPGIEGISLIADRTISPLTFRPPTGQSTGSPGTIQIRPHQSVARNWSFDPAMRAERADPLKERWQCMRFSMSGRIRVEPGACR